MTGDPTRKHHVETFWEDGGTHGWQCFTCREEAVGYDDFDAADSDADEHRKATHD